MTDLVLTNTTYNHVGDLLITGDPTIMGTIIQPDVNVVEHVFVNEKAQIISTVSRSWTTSSATTFAGYGTPSYFVGSITSSAWAGINANPWFGAAIISLPTGKWTDEGSAVQSGGSSFYNNGTRGGLGFYTPANLRNRISSVLFTGMNNAELTDRNIGNEKSFTSGSNVLLMFGRATGGNGYISVISSWINYEFAVVPGTPLSDTSIFTMGQSEMYNRNYEFYFSTTPYSSAERTRVYGNVTASGWLGSGIF